MFVAAVPELVMNTFFPSHFKNRIKTTNSLHCTTAPKRSHLGVLFLAKPSSVVRLFILSFLVPDVVSAD